jgi:monoamine oxidase
VALAGGPAAEEGRGLGRDRERRYLAELERLYPGLRRQVRQARFLDWSAEPWTQGGYSAPAPGEVTAVGPVLFAGLGRLHFAGEHASPAFHGFMEGALESGVRLARRLAKRDGVVR